MISANRRYHIHHPCTQQGETFALYDRFLCSDGNGITWRLPLRYGPTLPELKRRYNPHFHLYPVWKLEGTDKGTDVWSGVHAPVLKSARILAGPAQQSAPVAHRGSLSGSNDEGSDPTRYLPSFFSAEVRLPQPLNSLQHLNDSPACHAIDICCLALAITQVKTQVIPFMLFRRRSFSFLGFDHVLFHDTTAPRRTRGRPP